MKTDPTSDVTKTVLLPSVNKMNPDQLNHYLIKRANVICEYVRKKRTEFHTSDIMPPICQPNNSLQKNIDSVLACFGQTLAAALFSESQYIKILNDFEILSGTVESEKYLIFDFLNENGLGERFNDYIKDKTKNQLS